MVNAILNSDRKGADGTVLGPLSAILEHLKPGKGQRDSNITFDVGPAGASQSPSVKSVGITGQLTGSRADVIIADDVESLNNAMTSTMRDLLAERIKEFDAVLKPGGRVIYLGTPQTEMSIYNRLPERGYEIRIWPARIPVDPDKYQGRLAPFVMRMIQDGNPAGTPVDPKRFHDLDLLEREASYARERGLLTWPDTPQLSTFGPSRTNSERSCRSVNGSQLAPVVPVVATSVLAGQLRLSRGFPMLAAQGTIGRTWPPFGTTPGASRNDVQHQPLPAFYGLERADPRVRRLVLQTIQLIPKPAP
ncbi:phage terminase large subunit [Agrobacterium tumefaciens]|nr:phage terminase large subunit [Agrobacterium tumefaciens]